MNNSVGLDIGWQDIKVVELTHDLKIIKIGKTQIPRPIKNVESKIYAKRIEESFKAYKFSKDNVIINLRGSPILARTYSPPSKNHDDFEQWFVDNIEALIPGTPIADVVYDHQFLKSGRVLISFARLGAVDEKIKILKACDIVPAAIDASCLALYHAFDSHRWIKEKKNFAILDIGSYNSDLLMVKEGEPYVSTEIAFGGKNLKKGKDKYKTFIQKLAINLEKNMYYYKDKENLKIEGLILVGDYSNVRGLKKNLSNLLGIKIEKGNPFRLRKTDLPTDFNLKNSNQYTQALGLALKGLNSKIGINLMPPEYREIHKKWKFNRTAKRFFQRNAVISSICFVILLFLFYAGKNTNNKITKEGADLNARKNELLFVYNEATALNSKMSKINQLNNNPHLWSRMLYNIGSAVPEGIYLTLIGSETRLVSTNSKPGKKTDIVIEGSAKNEETVVSFLKNLEKQFNNIALTNIKEDVRCEFTISLAH